MVYVPENTFLTLSHRSGTGRSTQLTAATVPCMGRSGAHPDCRKLFHFPHTRTLPEIFASIEFPCSHDLVSHDLISCLASTKSSTLHTSLGQALHFCCGHPFSPCISLSKCQVSSRGRCAIREPPQHCPTQPEHNWGTLTPHQTAQV